MKKIKLTKKNLILFAVLAATAIAIVVLDQITKMMAVRAYEDGKLPVTVIKGVLSISYLENLGGAFGGMAGRHVLFFVLTVLALLLCAGWNNTAYYPSVADLQSSLTIANSCSSPFTLEVMSYVSILVPFVLGYIFYAWRALDLRKISGEEMQEKDTHAY